MRKSRQTILAGLLGHLQELQKQHDELVLRREVEGMREQILREIIQELDLVARLKHSMKPPSCGAVQLQLDCDTTSYVTHLFSMVQPAQVQQVLAWQAEDWHAFLADAASKLSLLLQLSSGNGAVGPPAVYGPIVEQQLCQVVDEIVTQGALGAIYSEVTGQQLGIYTSLNHISMQEEVPQQDFWLDVLQQLQLSQAQLLKLSAAYHELMRQCKAHHELQSSLSKAVACSNSCTLQLLAAAQSGSKATPGNSTASQLMSPDTGLDGGDVWDSSLLTPSPEACPSQLITRLLAMVSQTDCMLFLVLHNTLTRRQIASLLVASFPFVPHPAMLVEAASKQLARLRLGANCAPA